MQRKKQNFIEGAAILVVASLIVKVIGAVFQIPLVNLIGGKDNPAFGLFTAAYRIYMTMLVISTVGLPAALSKMVAEATAGGREHEVRRIVKVAAVIFIPFGAVCSVALYAGAGVFSDLIKSADARFAVMAIAPSVLMVCILSVFRGYYQGRANMVPTAVSQVIEALGKMFVGLGLTYYAVGQGYDAPHVAAMAVLGVTIGEVAAAFYMVVRAALTRKQASVLSHGLNNAVRPFSQLCGQLLSLSIPITITSAVMSLTDLIDMALISARLQSPAIAMTSDQAMAIYGVYTGYAVNFFNLPQTLITAISVSVLPVIAGARAMQNFTKVSKTMSTAFRLTLLITLPAGAGFLLFGQQIVRLVYSKDTVLGGQLLQILGFAVPAVALVAITNAILQAFGRVDLPLISMFIGALIKICGDYVMVADPRLQIAGAPVSTTLCYWVIALINLVQIGRLSHGLPPFGRTVVRPIAATIGMGASSMICFTLLSRALAAAPGSVVDKLVTLVSIMIAVLVYGVLLLLLHAVEREDVLLLPKGEKIANLLRLK